MSNQRLGSFSRAVADAMDDIRHNVVEVPMYGREVTSDIADFRNWLYGEPAKAKAEPEGKDKEEVEVEPLEGRPSTLKEREATAEAMAFYRDAGVSTAEIEDAHSAEWRNFAEWVRGGREAEHTEPDLGRDDLER